MLHEGLLAVHQHGEVELADCGHRAGDATADHRSHGGQGALGDLVTVLGGEGELVETGANTERVEQRIARGPAVGDRRSGGADDVVIDGHDGFLRLDRCRACRHWGGQYS